MHLLFRFLSRWPLPLLHAMGAVLGWLVWLLSPSYRRSFRANVAQAGIDFAQARPAIAHAGRVVVEMPRVWLRPHEHSCLEQVEVRGREWVDAALAQGRGVVFFAAHCGNFELGPQIVAELYGPFTVLYRPSRKPWLDRLISQTRGRPGLALAPASMAGVRQMLKALRAGTAVGMLADQVPPEGLGMWAPFFGRPAYTVTLAARLALQSGAPLIPVTLQLLPRGRGYVLEFRPPVAGLGTDASQDLEAAVIRMNQEIEALVRQQPGQYLWAYARYKQPRRESPDTAADAAA